MPRNKRDPLSDYYEWVEHKDNSGYWINRISWRNIVQWRLIRRHNRILGILGVIFCGFMFTTMVMPTAGRSFELSTLPVVVLVAVFFILSVMLLFQKPLEENFGRTQAEQEAINRKEKKERRKVLKRRKNYK